MDSQNIIVYDTHGFATLVTLEKSQPGALSVDLGRQPTLPHAVGEARRLGHKVDGWKRPDWNFMMDVNAIRTPHDAKD